MYVVVKKVKKNIEDITHFKKKMFLIRLFKYIKNNIFKKR